MPPTLIPGSEVSFGLEDASGHPLPTYLIDGTPLVVGEGGQRYSIAVNNLSPRRVEVVLSVDGLDVMDGRLASFSKRGYILPPRGHIRVQGFRTGPDTVAAFRFSSVSRSYSALKHGSTRNVGVIGVAVFTERESRRWAEPPPPRWEERELERRRRADPFPRS